MKKTIIALMGLFTLLACSEDVYDEIDLQNEQLVSEQNTNNGGMQVNSFDDSFHGYYLGGIFPGTGYVSPWDVWYRNVGFRPMYQFGNSTSNLTMTIRAYVGLAYYDDNNNGSYDDPKIAFLSGTTGQVADMIGNPALYPNLYAGSKEIGNLIRTQPIVIPAASGGMDNELAIISTDHLPVIQANVSTDGNNPTKKFFDLTGIATPSEIDLLSRYGKVFYYEVMVTDGVTSVVKILQAENTGISPVLKPHWNPIIGITANTPAGARPTYYYKNNTLVPPGTQWSYPYTIAPTLPPTGPSGFKCDSREVVIAKTYNSVEFTGHTGTSKLSIIVPQGSWLWQTSGLTLYLNN